jgi:hypothetical protein
MRTVNGVSARENEINVHGGDESATRSLEDGTRIAFDCTGNGPAVPPASIEAQLLTE